MLLKEAISDLPPRGWGGVVRWGGGGGGGEVEWKGNLRHRKVSAEFQNCTCQLQVLCGKKENFKYPSLTRQGKKRLLRCGIQGGTKMTTGHKARRYTQALTGGENREGPMGPWVP